MPHSDVDFLDPESSDISKGTRYLSKMLIVPPSSPQTPEKKCRPPKRSLGKSPSPSPISELTAEKFKGLDISAEEATETQNIPSPQKRRRMVWDVIGRGTYNKLYITRDKPIASQNSLSRKERRRLGEKLKLKLEIRKKEELDDIAAAPLTIIAGETCCGNESAVENRGMDQATGKVEGKLLSSGTEEKREGEETKDDPPVPENNGPIANEKKDSETYSKFLQLLYDQKETETKKEMEELTVVIESVKRMFMNRKLKRRLQKIHDRKTRDEMYLKALESLDDETGTESNDRTEDVDLIIEMFKFVRSGQLEKDLQTLGEIFGASWKGLDRLIREAEAACARKTQEEQPSSPISFKGYASPENDCQGVVPFAMEYEPITANDVQDKNVIGVKSLGKSSVKVKEPIWGAVKSRWDEDFPSPANFNDEAAMLQQAFIQSNYDEFTRLKNCCGTSCSTASGNNIINKKPNTTTIGSSETVNEEDIEDISPEDQQDTDDETSDTSESESVHFGTYGSDEEIGIDTNMTSEIGKSTELKDVSVASIECVTKDFLIDIAGQLKQDFTCMFQKKCCESTGNESGNSMDEMFIATTAAVVRRILKFFKLDTFGEALKKATEEILAEEKEKEHRCVTSFESTASIEQNIFKKWAIAYPETIPMRSFELMRAIDILISLTRSTPYNHAILEDTPECRYDALVVFIQYYLDTYTHRKCIEIVERHSLDPQIEWIRKMPSFVHWWMDECEEFERLWGKGVLNKEVLKNFDVNGGNLNEDEARRD
ncbi:hypothetical protein EAE96_005141 [Botrytis aclada]|nr:hypothetical protein EAE96_005141 [Botrytis aclada]